RRAVSVLHPHAARLDAADAPRIVAEKEYVAGEALDGEILVELPDDDSLGLRDHLVLRGVGDGPAARHRREPRPAPAADLACQCVAMEPCADEPARSPRDSLRVHLDDVVEVL